MDVKIFLQQLPADPTEDQYLFWKAMTLNFLKMSNPKQEEEINLLLLSCGPAAYSFVTSCKNVTDAWSILDKKYLKKSTQLLSRQILRNHKQKEGESIQDFLSDLKRMAYKIPLKNLTADEYQEILISDAFVSGIHSSLIRQRILEMPDSSLDEISRVALSMEMAIEDSQKLNPNDSTCSIKSNFNKSKSKYTGRCPWCGKEKHERTSCPAKNSQCKTCLKKGHWTTVCLSNKSPSKSAPLIEDNEDWDEPQVSSTLASIHSKRYLENLKIDQIPIKALIDTGSDLSFIAKSFIQQHKLNYEINTNRTITLADQSKSSIVGQLMANLEINNSTYNHTFYIMENLVAPLIIGMDILGQHSYIKIISKGNRKPLSFLSAMSSMKHNIYRLVPGIEIQSLKPISVPSRRFTKDPEFIKNEISRMLKEDIIQPSQSPWKSQCFVVQNSTKKRLVIDYSNTINMVTPIDAYPMPRIDDMISLIARNSHFSKIDLKDAYHQVRLNPKDYSITAFEANGTLYEFKRLPFGITNAVPIFQRVMNDFIKQYELLNTYAYLDDIIIAGSSREEHNKNLDRFRNAATEFGLTLNDIKCQYNTDEIKFLGYMIKNNTVRPDPDRFEPLLQFPTPRTIKQLDRLIGFFAYYAKWIPKCSERTTLLRESRTKITKDKTLSQECIATIKSLKYDLIKASLGSFDQDVPIHLETDASDNAIGATLSQQGKPIAFFSRVLQSSEKKHSIVEKEALAIVESCHRWRHFLLAVSKFTITTDQKVVSFLFDQHHTSKIKNDKICRWRVELAEFKFDINYRPGILNVAADTLSRCSSIFDNNSLKLLHSRLSHPGVTRMTHYCRQKNLPYSIHDVREMTSKCDICRELKPKFFQPGQGTLITSTRPWQRLSIDFVGPMISTTNNKYLLVVIDEYSRFPFGFPCSDISAQTVIKHLAYLFCLFGTPSTIHSDRGTQFESHEMKTFLLNNGIIKSRTTPYRPQANGQCEKTNGTVLKTIKLILKERKMDKSKWENVLHEALSSIRTLLSTATNETPHDRLFKFARSSIIGTDLPSFLTVPGRNIFLKRFNIAKNETPVERVTLVETLSPYLARTERSNGTINTDSTRHPPQCPATPRETISDDHLPNHVSSTPAQYIDEDPLNPPIITIPSDVSQLTTNISHNEHPNPIPETTKSGRHIRLPARFQS